MCGLHTTFCWDLEQNECDKEGKRRILQNCLSIADFFFDAVFAEAAEERLFSVSRDLPDLGISLYISKLLFITYWTKHMSDCLIILYNITGPIQPFSRCWMSKCGSLSSLFDDWYVQNQHTALSQGCAIHITNTATSNEKIFNRAVIPSKMVRCALSHWCACFKLRVFECAASRLDVLNG